MLYLDNSSSLDELVLLPFVIHVHDQAEVGEAGGALQRVQEPVLVLSKHRQNHFTLVG
jgi:hypothetical protein